jgi:vacuolar-type H+-ATPase subunit I/STV1
MMRTYDDWKIGYDEEAYPGPSKREVGERIADLEREIAWLKKRLDTLVLDEEDREQTIDYITELEEELHSILWSFQWPAKGGVRL